MRNLLSRAILPALAVMLWCGAASAGPITLTLHRTSLINVSDTAGTWQHEVGTIARGTTTVGEYFLVRRVETRSSPMFNAGMTTISLMFPSKTRNAPPENVTIQGSHSFDDGSFKGSVSATSSYYGWVRGADADYTNGGTALETLVIEWTGSDQLRVP